jgi:phosphoribosylanthranilate isomerase
MRENMRIKICGLKRPVDIEYANILKPDYVGFVFAGTKRKISMETAASLKKGLDRDIKAVGVFVNEPVENIIGMLEKDIIDIAQLHGDESEEDILYIKAVTSKPVIKAVRAKDRYDVEAWLDSAADYLLFDSGAGSGQVFDWDILADIERDFLLAGGLALENIKTAIETVKPFALDLSSGVETDGVKDFKKMKKVIETVRETGFR